jgi:hypothetical protein
MIHLGSYITGSNVVILNEVGQTTAVFLVGCIMDQRVCQDTALGHLMNPLGNVSLRVWISMTCQDWTLSSHKGK